VLPPGCWTDGLPSVNKLLWAATNRMIEEESLATAQEGIDLARPDYSRKPPPLPAPGRFKTMLHLRSWAGERFPRATLVTEGLDLRAWNRIAPVLESLATDWPGVARELGWITTRHPFWEDDSRRVIAAADVVFGEKLAFNPLYFGRPKKLREAASFGERVGLYPRGAKDAGEWYFVSHEWGHLLHAWLRRHRNPLLDDLMALFASNPAVHTSSFDPDKAAAISLNAKRGMTEAFADAFSLIQWNEKNRWPEIVRLFSRILGGEP
jgi:hypothetical protein